MQMPPKAAPSAPRLLRQRWARLLWLVAALGVPPLAGAAESEQSVKAAYLYHFTSLVKWPETSFTDANAPLVIGVVGKDPFEGSLARSIRPRSANGRQIEIRQLNSNDKAGMRQCHLIYLSPGEIAANAVEAVKGLPVLMVGDSDRAAQDGCCIGLVMRNQRIKLEINQETARQARLSISSDLLGIATLVRKPPL